MEPKFVSADPGITIDDHDHQLLSKRIIAWKGRNSPRVGEFVILPDGDTRRFTHHWKFPAQDNDPEVDRLQTTRKDMPGSFHLFRNGYASYSGSLDRGFQRNQLIDTGKRRDGVFWFFHHDYMRAHNAVYCTLPCRVYRVRELTITERFANVGYTYRANSRSDKTGKHEIYDGRDHLIGEYDAREACELLAKLEA